MEEQVTVLRRIDERQRAIGEVFPSCFQNIDYLFIAYGDLSKQPIPEVPATSSSAWNALLRSALTDTIQPKVERWRSGLDALLVFVRIPCCFFCSPRSMHALKLGLFSAIVTSFFVQSLTALSQDPNVRTNELLANLTDIIIAISGVPAANLHVPQPVTTPASSFALT
ncbi:hypothetical protein DFH07DRAFT_726359 [Mycena maculata]|uniref:DUF6535 domain-containing protein n=1 Tax=Mycena maculata TaxID=230809 RepID=A0AAD7KGS4_9AGAR|nr:hypothetical protein DFH07DRAFT_726359 [Mycena maculata]